MKFLGTILLLALLYLGGTGYAGYQRGTAAGQYLGGTGLAELMAQTGGGSFEPAPDWETISPTFALGINLGMCEAARHGPMPCMESK